MTVDVPEVRDRARRANAGGDRGLEHLKLLLERQRVAVDHPHACSTHKQLATIAELDRPGFLRGPAGELAQLDDVSAEALRQFVFHADWPPSTTSVWPVT